MSCFACLQWWHTHTHSLQSTPLTSILIHQLLTTSFCSVQRTAAIHPRLLNALQTASASSISLCYRQNTYVKQLRDRRHRQMQILQPHINQLWLCGLQVMMIGEWLYFVMFRTFSGVVNKCENLFSDLKGINVNIFFFQIGVDFQG